MSSERPPWPGPRPADLQFPFDLASAAAQETRDLAAAVDLVRRRMVSEGHDVARTEFRGLFARWFADTGDECDVALADLVDRLEEQAAVIDALVATAGVRIEDRQVEVEQWTWRHRAWQEWSPLVGVAS